MHLIPAIRDVLVHILKDRRWDRAWIFQEDHCAGMKMRILISHTEDLDKSNSFDYDFENVPNELLVGMAKLRQASTLFCLACKNLPSARIDAAFRRDLNHIIAKLKQYNLWNKVVHRPDSTVLRKGGVSPYGNSLFVNEQTHDIPSLYHGGYLNILEDIISRSVKKQRDRIPIAANCGSLSIRLNAARESPLIKSGKYGLSTCLLYQLLRSDTQRQEV